MVVSYKPRNKSHQDKNGKGKITEENQNSNKSNNKFEGLVIEESFVEIHAYVNAESAKHVEVNETCEERMVLIGGL